MAGAVARRQVVRAFALGLVVMAVVAPTPPVVAQEAQEGLRWASLGDSFAAGEGLEHPSRASQTDQDCQRALAGDEFPSVAWGAAAAENRAGPFAFVACTGAITDDLFPAPAGRLQAGQRDQAMFVSGQTRFDVVTFSFGGNNIGFDDVLLGCAGISATGGVTAVVGGGLDWAAAPWVGCTLSEQEMKDRIDALTDPSSADGPLPACDALGDNASAAQHWDGDELVQGRITLPELYDVIGRCVAAPGGTVVVMGYPQLLEEADRWGAFEGNRCARIRRADIGKLRGATAHLNYRISEAVAQANATTPANFVFVDPNHFWEGGSEDLTEPSDAARNDPANRHALCGGGEDWLNGVTIGLAGDGLGRPQRSFHPKQQGHDAMARAASMVPYDCAWPQYEHDEVLRVTAVHCADGWRLTRWFNDGNSHGSALLERDLASVWQSIATFGTDCPGGVVGTAEELIASGLPTHLADLWGEPYIADSCQPSGEPPTMPGLDWFRTPTGNIGCLMTEDHARCDIREADWEPPPRPPDCVLDWGASIGVEGGAAEFQCNGDTVLPADNVLPYGSVLRRGAFECRSDESGVDCRNVTTGHGFHLSRGNYEIY